MTPRRPLVLFVCTGNVCRSPLAAGMLVAALSTAPAGGPRVESAGTRPLVGADIDPESAVILSRLGSAPVPHRARPVTAGLLGEASMILTATRAHRGAVVEIMPRAVQYTWTIRQAGLILTQTRFPAAQQELGVDPKPDPADDPADGVEWLSGRVDELSRFLNRHRGLHYRPDRSDDDVVDPYRQPRPVHERADREMIPALSLLSEALGGRPLGWPSSGEPEFGTGAV